MTTKPIEVLQLAEVDGLTGKVTYRNLTSEELEQKQLDSIESKTQQAEADAKIATRSSALAKLAAIGLTPEEIASL
jgi:hypothetical protein